MPPVVSRCMANETIAAAGWCGARGRERNDADLRIDRPGRANDVGVQLARIEAHRAVLHVKAAIEREAVFVGVART